MDDSIKIITLSPGRYRVYKGAEQFDCAHIDDVITCVYQCLTEQKVTSAVPVKGETIDFDRFTEFFNSSVCGTVIPQVRKLTDKRKKTIKARLAEKEVTKATLMEVVTRAAASDFLSGRNGQWQHCSFDWIFNPNNFQKILEGNYDNRHYEIRQESLSSGRGQRRNPTAYDIARDLLGESSG
ncbi:MAG: hypothetical protein K1V90_08705 [Muribaculaceae bacterium]